MQNNKIKNLISKMTKDKKNNLKLLKKEFGSLEYRDEENQSLLHILVDDKYDEEKCFFAIASLLEYGLSPNLEADYNYNFIQTALYTGYSENFIINIIKESIQYNLDVNHTDDDKDTIMHTAIYSDDYLGEIEAIYKLLCEYKFDSSKKDHEGKTLIDAMIYQKQYSNNQIDRFKQLFRQNYLRDITNKKEQIEVKSNCNDKKLITELKNYGKVLNEKHYLTSPTIGREKEVNNVIITLAQERKMPIIVGESGVGKTAIVDELAYRIKNGNVPRFLQDKIILEVNPNNLVAGCQYVGQFEDKMTKLLQLCEVNDVLLFIDEIHTIYGIGSTRNKSTDMASILKSYIDRSDIKVIGTTTEKEYNEFFSDDALKRRFEKVIVKEPETNTLNTIIDKVIEDYSTKNNIYFENDNIKNKVISVILSSTEKRHRVYNDIVNNPDLSISIIDKAFAFAKVYESETITKDHFIESFELCDRLYESAKEQAIFRLKNINEEVIKQPCKVIKIDFNNYKK